MKRRTFLWTAAAAMTGIPWFLTGCASPDVRSFQGPSNTADALAGIERQSGGRLGVWFLDTQSGGGIGHKGDERFPMCSTFKFLAIAATLARVDGGKERLGRAVAIHQSDILAYAPVTKAHVGQTMTVGALCEAAITLSDNSAADILLHPLGGPVGLTAWLRSIGDGVSRLDRTEPTLNEALPGDPRDTTTPKAMVATMDKILLGHVLSEPSRKLLVRWLLNCQTGGARIRAGLPGGWRVGDKTGTGDRGTANDIAIIYPPNRRPLLLVVFLTQSIKSPAAQSATIAAVARSVVRSVLSGAEGEALMRAH